MVDLMPRFVILAHDYPELHWDFMMETGDVLRTWRLAEAPYIGATDIAATAIGDHRNSYLDYEGPVSGGRGNVTRWDSGTYETVVVGDDAVQVRLRGRQLDATVLLQRLANDRWTCALSAPS
jgi:hypothetical protein